MKKCILALVLLTFNMFVNATTLIEGIKDSCESKYDVFQFRHGVYQADVEDLFVEGDFIGFKVNVNFLLCEETSTGVFERVPSDPMRDVVYDLPVSSTVINHVVAKTQAMSMKFMKHDIFKLIKVIPMNDRATRQTLETELNIKDILSDKEREELSRNQVVKTHFSFFIVKNVIWTSTLYPEIQEDLVFSAYRKILEIRKEDGILKARFLK